MRHQPARLFVCGRCRAQVLVCSHCDRGQRYCADGCAQVTRNVLQRDAARRYQASRAGRFKHAARMRRWRERRAALLQSVTHQGSAVGLPDGVVAPSSTPAAPVASPPCLLPPVTVAAVVAGLGPALFPDTWHCRWCRTRCPSHLRWGFLRRAPALGLTHGHSP